MIFVMTTYNRPDYVRYTLNSLIKSDFGFVNDCLYIYDDASDSETLSILMDFVDSARYENVYLVLRPQHLGIHFNCTRSLYEAMEGSGSEYAFNIDSDTMFHPHWRIHLGELFNDLKDAKIGALSLFNTTIHPVTGRFNSDIVIKKSVGGFGSLFHRDPMKILVDKKINKDWDWEYLDEAKKLGLQFYCSDKSYLDHMGYIGTNGPVIDRASNFALDN